jgi:hypothetical protein
MTFLQIYTGKTADDYVSVVAPALLLYPNPNTTFSGLTVVNGLSQTVFVNTNTDASTKISTTTYYELEYSFQLLSALLDSAPTNDPTGKNALFSITCIVTTSTDTNKDAEFVVRARIQVKGYSSMSPTFVTKLTDGKFTFPVTTFFNVSSPGAPYTITITATSVDPETQPQPPPAPTPKPV